MKPVVRSIMVALCIFKHSYTQAQISGSYYACLKVITPVTLIKDDIVNISDKDLVASASNVGRITPNYKNGVRLSRASAASNITAARIELAGTPSIYYCVSTLQSVTLYEGINPVKLRLIISSQGAIGSSEDNSIDEIALKGSLEAALPERRAQFSYTVPLTINYN